MSIIPVLLAGGQGTRLWPLSRQSFPKQFVQLIREETAFQQTAARFTSDDNRFGAPIVVTQEGYRFTCSQQLAAIGIDNPLIMLEPQGKGTAPPILAAALHVTKDDPEALLLVAPTDHDIRDKAEFLNAVSSAAKAAQAGKLVCFGIAPNHPETGYGYIEATEGSGATDDKSDALAVKRFVEKPDRAAAQAMLDEGGYFWNAGIFLFSAKSVIAAFSAHAKDMLVPVRAAYDKAEIDGQFLRFDEASWRQIEPDSVDYAIMEKADNVAVMPYGGNWSDLGDWNAVHKEGVRDENGVGQSGPVTSLNSKSSLLRSENPDVHLVGVGIENIVAIATKDAVLVANMDATQDVGKAVQMLKAEDVIQATQNLTDFRPWGSFEILADQPGFKVKRIIVKPSGKLSLQSHEHRSEHWVVVRGVATIVNGDQELTLSANQSTYIEQGAVHRLSNLTDQDVEIIEVQTGSYLGEDDIVRYDDVYKR